MPTLSETDLQRESARLVDREVNCCLSSLVATLAQSTGRSCEACDPIGELAEQAFELASPVDDYEEAATQAGWYVMSTGQIAHDANPDLFDKGCWQSLCDEQGIEPYSWEVYEFWAVSTWLADHLIAHGEKVDRDFAGLNVWARTTTGQASSMDGVIRAITQEIFK